MEGLVSLRSAVAYLQEHQDRSFYEGFGVWKGRYPASTACSVPQTSIEAAAKVFGELPSSKLLISTTTFYLACLSSLVLFASAAVSSCQVKPRRRGGLAFGRVPGGLLQTALPCPALPCVRGSRGSMARIGRSTWAELQASKPEAEARIMIFPKPFDWSTDNDGRTLLHLLIASQLSHQV
jgi:hypothetical protein